MDKILRAISDRLHIARWHIVAALLMVYDAAAVSFSSFFALWIRFDCRYSMIPPEYLKPLYGFMPILIVCTIAVFWLFRLYRCIWQYAGFPELVRITLGCLAVIVLHIAGITLLYHRMPLSYYFGGSILMFMLVLASRFSYRVYLSLRRRMSRTDQSAGRVMLIGAGSAGQLILHDMARSGDISDRPCCIIDDNPNKWGRFLDGVPIVGGRDDILKNVEKYSINKIYFAIPSADAKTRRDILSICSETGCALKNLPGFYQFVNDEICVSEMRDVALEDLLGRDPIEVNTEEICASLAGKVILVTGGGGSIGSELCRQIAGHSPARLVIFDIYENNAYEIQQELRHETPDVDLVVEIGSVRDSRRIEQIFAKYRPDIVYHAAAHKHVPLMEGSPCEAIKNNVFGTYKTAYAAMRYGCGRFVLVSTDKAVNPTNIMGASKRICEMIIQLFDRKLRTHREDELPVLCAHEDAAQICACRPAVCGGIPENRGVRTEFVAVRFGNVLGSNGSVVPLFKKMIAKGGPVEVTHRDIIRYFMTIPEAVSLILQAGAYAKGGEIFVLDMGEPMKIDTLARNLIKLSGYKPDEDIKIIYTGLRPGEKLYEEKLMAEEGLSTTANHLIHIAKPIDFDADELLEKLPALMEAAYNNAEDIRELTREIVSTYHPEGENTAVSR